MKTIKLKDFNEVLVSRKQAKFIFEIANKEDFDIEFDFE